MQQSLKVIIVEDEAVIAQLIEFHLQQVGHKVLDIAHDSERALDLIHNLRPDLVLLDINILGTKDGIEVGKIVQEKYNVPIIFITALSDPKTLERAREVRPVSYLIKPYKADDLYAAISIGMYNFENRKAKKEVTKAGINKISNDDLTDREFEILKLLVEGLSNDQIAQAQYVTVNTIKWHSTNIYSKLGVKNRTSVAKLVAELLNN
jgi:DNA-binding NarL/FixJ family response regulator